MGKGCPKNSFLDPVFPVAFAVDAVRCGCAALFEEKLCFSVSLPIDFTAMPPLSRSKIGGTAAKCFFLPTGKAELFRK